MDQLEYDDLISIIALLARRLGGLAVIPKSECRGEFDIEINFTDDDIVISYRPVLAIVRMPRKGHPQ